MANKFAIKADPSFPHHYIFTIGVTGMHKGNPGHIFLKHGPIYVHHKDIENMGDAFYRVEDEVFKQSESEALKAEGVYEVVLNLLMMRLSAQANGCTIHHLSFESKLDDDQFVSVVESSNIDEKMRKKIYEGLIRL